ncbi:MAG: hypothetical protein VW683_10330 [Betaproteobacteria bacterium]|jgi:hypothetical protein
MGYTTDFDGYVEINPPLNSEQRDYINKFSRTRRMHRNNGPYFVGGTGEFGQGHDTDIINFNSPDPSQPGLWCQWVVSDDGSTLEWDGGEKFYNSAEWMVYLIQHFLGNRPVANGDPNVPDFGTGRTVNGTIYAQGEDSSDCWRLCVVDNEVTTEDGNISYGNPRVLQPKRMER